MWTAFWPSHSKRVIIPDVKIVIDSAAHSLILGPDAWLEKLI